MAISRAQLLKELLPGLNALFGLEYAKYGEEHKEIFETETSERSFEEETKLSGFSAAPVKNEGQAIAYDNAQEAFTARYQHETIALGFSITEEAIEDNLYDSLSARYTKGLARAMAYTKQVKAASILNNAFTGGPTYGDGVVLAVVVVEVVQDHQAVQAHLDKVIMVALAQLTLDQAAAVVLEPLELLEQLLLAVMVVMV